MSDPFLWAAVISGFLGVYFSILKQSLAEFSRGEVESLLGDSQRVSRVAWVAEWDDELILSTAIWRRFFSVTLLVCVLVSIARAEGQAPSAMAMILGAVGVLMWLYVTEIGVGTAVAEHSASSVVKGALWFLPAFFTINKPLTAPLLVLNEVVRRLVGAEVRDDLEDDIRQVVEESEREGSISETERDMLEAIVDFRTATAEEVMTPRIDIKALPLTDDLDSVKQMITEVGHSRFPVFDETIDRVLGVLHVKDLLAFIGRDKSEFHMRDVLREVPYVPESRRISDLLVEFQTNKTQLAIVLDEYGGTAGLVTIEDIIEEIVGEIRDEHEKEDITEPTIIMNGDGAADVDARVHIDDLNDELGINLPEDADFETVGGWVFATLGRIPGTGERFDFENLEIEVLEAERTHIARVRIRPKNGREKTPVADVTSASETEPAA